MSTLMSGEKCGKTVSPFCSVLYVNMEDYIRDEGCCTRSMLQGKLGTLLMYIGWS